jgi:hypothetical protein
MGYYHPNPFKHGLKVIGIAIAGVFTAVIFGLIFGYVVQWLWNWLMPTIFGLVKISYWQAFGLVILARLIFGSFGHHGAHAYRHKRHQHWAHYHHGWDSYGPEDQAEDCKIKGKWKNWSYYDQWWKAEGKAAFENYIERTNQSEEK